jgi:uncharacterized protein
MDLFDAVTAGDLQGLTEVVRKDPSTASARNAQGLSLLLHALYHGRDEMVDALLATGIDLDLFEAAALGDSARVASLLDAKPDEVIAWSVDGFTPLHLAVFFGHPDTAKLLIERGADPSLMSHNPMEVMPIHSAAAGRSPASVEAVLDAGVDVDARSHGGFTALHDAAQNGDRAIVELLLDRGADPALMDERGRTARDLATAHGHQDVVDLLEDRG